MGTKYSDKKDTCQWCNKEMDSGVNGERPKQYCSDECRYQYHNAKKKLQREKSNAIRAINYIQSLLLKHGDLLEDALAAARNVEVEAQVLGFDCYCGECKQHRMTVPLKGDKCSFCQSESWRFRLPVQNPERD